LYAEEEEKKVSEVSPQPPSVHPQPKQHFADSLRRLFQTRNNVPQHALASSTTSSTSLDIACHCLIVDGTRLAAGSEDAQQLAAALALSGNRQALRQHIKQWILDKHQLSEEEMCVAYVSAKQPRQLHINFRSHAGLAAALSRVNFLVRCGSTAATQGAWGRAHTCGKERHNLPELLQFSCLPTRPRELSNLRADVERLLKEEAKLLRSNGQSHASRQRA
jgi:hypothetical protein